MESKSSSTEVSGQAAYLVPPLVGDKVSAEDLFAFHFALTGKVYESIVDSGYTEAGRAMSRATAYKVASRLLSCGSVQAKILEVRKAKLAQLDLSDTKVLLELSRIGFANMLDYCQPAEDGSALIPDFGRLTREEGAAIQEVTVDEYMEGRGEGARKVKRTKIKLYSKSEALDSLAKHLGLYKEHNKQGVEAFLAFLAAQQGVVGENLTDVKAVERSEAPVLTGSVIADG